MVKFGPSGNDSLFFEEGHENNVEAPEWVSKMGLDCYEYPFTYGVNTTDENAIAFGNEAKKHKISVSAHAPYYVNFGSEDEEAMQKGASYIINSIKKLKLMGGNRIVVHLGATSKKPREEVLDRIKNRLILLKEYLDASGESDFMLFFEVMGKYSQIGNMEEILELTKIDERYNICLDAGHLNCLMQGKLNGEEAMHDVFEKIKSVLSPKKFDCFHIHFSKIMFNVKGEVKHLNFNDEGYELNPQYLLKQVKKYGINPWIICESKGKMAQDAKAMKKIFKKL